MKNEIRKPNLFIVGAPRCGTGSIVNWLNTHPDVFINQFIEPLFFSKDVSINEKRIAEEKEYLSLFNNGKDKKWVGEKTTSYLYSEEAPKKIKKYCPDARIIVMLRKPLDIIKSLHNMCYNSPWDYEDIANLKKALEEESKRKNKINSNYEKHFYKESARYSQYVKRYLDTFGEKKVFIIILEELKVNPEKIYGDLLKFLKIKKIYPKFKVYNKEGSGKGTFTVFFLQKFPTPIINIAKKLIPLKLRMFFKESAIKPKEVKFSDKSLEKNIRKEFKPEIKKLSKLIKKDLKIWDD